jgi:hypothetical protein
MRIAAALTALSLCASPAAAGPYLTGLGLGDYDLFPDGLFPEYSAPFEVGGGYATDGPVLRVGLAALKYDDLPTLAPPAGMLSLDVMLHFAEATVGTIVGTFQYGFGPIMAGAGVGAILLADGPVGAVVTAEVSLPLRFRLKKRFSPSVIAFARAEIPVSERDVYDDQILLGASVLVW